MANDGSVKIDIEADSSDFKDEIDGLGDEAKKAGDGLEDMGDGAKQAGEQMGALDVAAGTFIAGALQSLISGLGNAVGELMGLAEATRDYRDDMAKLETAFTTAGHSTETASQLYEDFYAILGESDRSVEAVNHLAELTKSEEDLAKWADIAAGVTAKFGDSLPIEGLTEAANETAKVGAVTGPLADALNWAGISEDEFNEKLAACNTEQERAALITETLNQEYKTAADEYNKLTENTQNARRATAEMEEAQANLGASIEPVTTAWTNLKANALEAILPVVQTVAGWIMQITTWLQENQTAATIITAVVIALAAALGVLAVALGIATLIDTVKTAFASLNLTMLANPIVLIIAGIATLVAAFIYLWNNCEGFREFWIGLWAKIKDAAGAIAEWFKSTWSATLDWLKSAVAKIKDFFSEAWTKIKEVFSNSTIGNYFRAIWETIKGIFSVVKSVLSGNWSDAWAAIKGIASTWAGFFSDVWTKIKGVFSNLASWFGEKFQSAKESIFQKFADIKAKFSEVKDKIFGAFDDIKDKFSTIGQNILDGIWAGIQAGWDWLKGKVKEVANSLFGSAKDALAIKSPSRKFRYIGEMMVEGIADGVEKKTPIATAAVRVMSDSILSLMQKEAEKYEKLLKDETAELSEIERGFASDTVAIWNDLSANVSKLQQDYANAYESRVEQIKNSLGLFSTAEKGTALSAEEMTTALDSQVALLADYNAALENLAARGLDDDFLEELRGLGIDATAELETLNSMSDEQLADYVELWKQKTELAREAAHEELTGLREDTLSEIEALNKGAAEQYIQLCAEYEALGLQLAADMSSSMLTAVENGLGAIEDNFDDFTKAGSDLISGLAVGMDKNSGAVAEAARAAVREAIEAAKEEAGIASPSKVMRDEIGKNLALGVGVGWDANVNEVNRSIVGDMDGLTARIKASVSAESIKAGRSMGRAETGYSDLIRAVGTQTAGINSLSAQYRKGAANMRPVILEVSGRELGRTVIDVGGSEETRIGAKLSYGGAY